MATPDKSDITRGRFVAMLLLLGLELIAFGRFIIFASLNMFSFLIGNVWYIAVLIFLGVAAVTFGALNRSKISCWAGVIFLTCALVSILAQTTGAGYGHLYPIYIASPAIASAVMLPFVKNKRLMLKLIIFFGGVSLIFVLNSTGLLNIFIVLAIFVVIGGAMLVVNALTSRKGKWDEGDRPQRHLDRWEENEAKSNADGKNDGENKG